MKIIERPDTVVITSEQLVHILHEAVMAKTGRRVHYISGCRSDEVNSLGSIDTQQMVRLELVLLPESKK